jgi:tRNA threonylcarbamoyladenosine biosynthesis protein TsaE
MSSDRAALTHRCADEDATRGVGRALVGQLLPGTLLSLEGELGAGKTVLVGGLAEGCGIDRGRVASPSFVLAVEHPEGDPPLLHVDLYRLPDGAGLDELGVEDALSEGWLVAVEWGERLPRELRRHAWRVILRAAEGDPTARDVTVLPPDAPADVS